MDKSKKLDERDCSLCKTRMELKGTTDLFHEDELAPKLWQCPKCKNVELL